MVNAMLSYSGLNDGFWGEAMLTACYLLNRVPNSISNLTPYELWHNKKPNFAHVRVWGCRAVVRLPQPKLKTLGEKGVECIFIGYAQHSLAYRFYVIAPNKHVSIHTIIESRDAIFDEKRFSSISMPKDLILAPSTVRESRDPQILDNRRSKRARKEKLFGNDFQMYLVEGTREDIGSQYLYCHIIENDPKTFDEAMKSQDVSFWKEAINDEMDSIMGNNTWILVDLPPGHKALGNKWIFRKKMKVDDTIDKFKARLVIQGFRHKYGMDYFVTYAPIARISTIRLLIALASIRKLLVHQMDAPMQWHQNFDEVVLSDGFVLNQSDKCVYSKFDNSGNGVIICLYVDDMLIFGTSLECINQTKDFLSSKFFMKDMGEAEVILGIRIERVEGGIALTQSHYIEKVLKKYKYLNCHPVNTPIESSKHLLPNKGYPVSQLEYSRVIGSLMYAMTSTRPDIAFAVGKLSLYTSNPSVDHWQAVHRVLRYLKGMMNLGLVYLEFPSVIEGYSDASWISNEEDHSSTNGWVFLLGGGAISWASKKQTCISSSTMESEFVALAAASKEAEWLKNMIHEIPLWERPISPISIHCDSAATLAKVYSHVYNGKSRHLGVRHSAVRELITHGVISVDFVKSQQNLADHLTKGLARDLIFKSVKGMRLKPI
ncbi:unnamed protein product [Rhodiola kirilowii]